MARALKPKISFSKDTKFKSLIFPGYDAPVVLEVDGERVAESRFWGFITRFPGKRDPDQLIEKIMQNAVSETLEEKRTFSGAWKKNQRCLIPAKSFLEPKDGKFTPIHVADEDLVVMAGIYSEVTYKEKKHAAFTMLTCEPNKFMEAFHDRMPVILGKRDWDEWLSPDTPHDQALKLCKPFNGNLAFAVG